ncbi:hypothetical protein [Phocaeicola plebeius]|uniref:hypothetical protein n=1 Tax=Phocaeicola plebeius TaxID=310297 RepID=UPI0026F32EC7|nr:hypothetical protein [Phocaeicola plebeius]
MKLTDKRFWIFEALSLVCGELTFCIAAGIWFALSQVNWFSEWTIQLTILLCWALGAIFSWITFKSANNIPFKTYILTNCVYLALTICNVSNGDASINGWYIMSCLGFVIVSLPAFILKTIINTKISQITNSIKAVGLVMLTALPLVVINFMGSNLGIGKEDMIKNVANEVIGMVDNFKDKNGRLPIGLNEIGTPFKEINETYEYKDYIFYYEPRKDGFYWLTITFGPDENYCYNSKNNVSSI